MSLQTQSIIFNAVPLLVVAAAYLAITASLVPTLWRQRARAGLTELALALVFLSVSVMAAIFGAVVLHDRSPVGGHVWPPFAGVLVALLPALLILGRWRERGLVATGPIRAREAEEMRTLRDRELEAASRLSTALALTEEAEEVARAFLDEVSSLFRVGFAGLSIVSKDGSEARGFLARRHGEDWPDWRELRFDLEHEPSGVSSAVFEASPLAVYDVQGSATVHRRVAREVGARSAAFVPLVTHERVIAVLSLASTDELRAFTGEELSLLQALAAEAAVALDRARSAAALAQALERERLVATISRRLRSELDLDAVLAVAVEETARALDVSRCFVRLGETGPVPIAAEWNAPGFETVAEVAERLPAANIAARERRTVAIADVDHAAELSAHRGVETLLSLDTRSVLATPIVALQELVGVFVVHRAEVGAWSEGEISLAEAVAQELGLAIHVARLLEQNRVRIGQQSSLLGAAQVLTGDLELEGVLQRLADQVSELLQADGADCYLYDTERGILRCAAVHGLSDDLVGFEFSAESGLSGEAIRRGRPLIATDYHDLSEPVPHGAYDEFTDVIVAPMRWADEVQGVLGVGRRAGKRPYTQSEADILEAFAGLASLALRNAETFSQSARQARVQRGFYRIAFVLGRSLSRSATLEAVAQAAAEALGGDFAAVLMPQGGRLALAGSFELPEPLSQLLEEGLSEDTALGGTAGEHRVLAASAVTEDERFIDEWRALAVTTPFTALLSVPVAAPRHDPGGLVVVFFSAARSFTDDDLELARHLADATRGALERSELFEAERTSRALAQQLARTGSVLATELEPAAVLDEVVQQAARLLGADGCAIRVLEDDELVVAAAEGAGAEEALGTHSQSSSWLSGDVIQSRAPVAIEDVSGERRFQDLDPMLGAGHCSFLGVPLVGPEGALHGVLAVYGRRPRAWREEEVEALRALAANTSAALSNAELYQRVALEKERSFAILANIADGIVAVDREGNVVLWNAAAEEITGVPAAEALGRTPAQVLQRSLESDSGTPIGDDRLVSIQRGGEEAWLSLTEAVMRDPTGAVAGRIFAFRDISSDRLVEQMKSDFVSAVSHELRTPLTSIYGFAETLLRQDVLFGEEERRTFLGYIASESLRLTVIVDALLNVGRIDTGDLQLNLAPTDVREVVSEVLAGAQENGDGHSFVIELPDEPLAAQADREKLRQVFSILVDNAVKYSPEGGTVTIGATRRDETVEVRVDDEGPGIPQGEQERIFRKFYRGADAGERRLGAAGSGLGLFIARGLVAAMGGRIWVTSADGQGSSFGFELPLARTPAEPGVRSARGRV
ncbi:MAG: GAF domain-containing protein [Gaiellaceae bacterium]